jgi:hypothetical protein
MMRSKTMLLAATSAALVMAAGGASATSLFVPGSTFTASASNSPDTYSDTVTLVPGTTTVDGGAVNLTISEVSQGADEWLVFSYSTVSGGPLSQPGDYWTVDQTGLDAATNVNLVAAYIGFTGGGTPTYSIFGGYSVGSNPVPGETGTGFVDDPLTPPYHAGSGPLPELGSFISPWDYLDDTGINSADVTGYTEALEFAPVSAIPEPATWAVMLVGFGALGGALRSRRRSPVAA